MIAVSQSVKVLVSTMHGKFQRKLSTLHKDHMKETLSEIPANCLCSQLQSSLLQIFDSRVQINTSFHIPATSIKENQKKSIELEMSTA